MQNPADPTFPFARSSFRSASAAATMSSTADPDPVGQGAERTDDAERFGATLKERRRERQVAVGREPVGDPADVVVEPKHLVEHDDRRPRTATGGHGEVARQATVGGGESGIRHGSPHPLTSCSKHLDGSTTVHQSRGAVVIG
jgi:hypothetical protein